MSPLRGYRVYSATKNVKSTPNQRMRKVKMSAFSTVTTLIIMTLSFSNGTKASSAKLVQRSS